MSNVYLTSDLHFGHENLIKRYRNFKSVEKHDKTIINNWNKIVNKNDKVFLLGDLSMEKDVSHLLLQLKGNIVLLGANHDKVGHILHTYSKLPNIVGIGGFMKYKGYWLSHCPIHPSELRGKKNIHGHIHKNKVKRFGLFLDKRYINVCVDHTGLKPVLFDDIKNGKYK